MDNKTEKANFVRDLKNILRALESISPINNISLIDPNRDDPMAENEDSAIGELNELGYIGDIVGNTICSDLLDYLARDAYFLGIELSYDDRIIQNFVVFGDNERDPVKKRLALLLVRKGKLRRDMITSISNLLEIRYQLAQAAYYHRVKAAASAMLIDLIYSAKKSGILTSNDEEDDLFDLTDDEVLYKVRLDLEKRNLESNNEYTLLRIRKILGKYRKRHIYKPAYILNLSNKEPKKIQKIINTYIDPENRFTFQKNMEMLLKLNPGSAVLYVTKKDRGKDAHVKVLWSDNNVRSIKSIAEDDSNADDKEYRMLKVISENRQSRYENLWNLYVFLDEDNFSSHAGLISGYCKDKIYPINDIEDTSISEARNVDDVELYLRNYHPENMGKSEELRNAYKDAIDAMAAKSMDRFDSKPEIIYCLPILDIVWGQNFGK